MLYPKYCLEPLVFFSGVCSSKQTGSTMQKSKDRFGCFSVWTLKSWPLNYTKHFQINPRTCRVFSAPDLNNNSNNNKTNKHVKVFYLMCAPPKYWFSPSNCVIFSPHSLKLPKKKSQTPQMINFNFQPLIFKGEFAVWVQGVLVNWRFGVWWFCWLILGTWKTSPPCLCCILRHSTRIGTSGRPRHLLLWHGLTEPENGVRKPTYYATMRFRGDWTPQSFSDNMIRYSPYQQVSRVSSINSINQLRFKTLRFLLLFLPTLVQINVFSFSFTLRRFRLRSEREIHTRRRTWRTHFSNRRPSYGMKNQPTRKAMK